MPQRDRSGPMGQGPMTGRAMGICTGNGTLGFRGGYGGGMGKGFGYGFGRGRGGARGMGRGMGMGMGYGWGHRTGLYHEGFFMDFPWARTITREDEIKILKAQAEYLKRSQNDIEKRLKELEQESESGNQ